MALFFWGFKVPYVSYAIVMGPNFLPHSNSNSFGGAQQLMYSSLINPSAFSGAIAVMIFTISQ
jgi:hypothetical protein